MQVSDCSVVTVIEGINYCLIVLHEKSWLEELNALSPLQISALLTATALTWYVASGIRTVLNVIGHTSKDE